MDGRIKAVFGNMVVAHVDGRVVKNAVGHCLRSDGAKLLCEAIRIRGKSVDLQIFEETRGLRVGDPVEFSEGMLSATLGPGLLGQVFDGLQNPLPQLAEKAGYFLKPGTYVEALNTEKKWDWTPTVKSGDQVKPGADDRSDIEVQLPLSGKVFRMEKILVIKDKQWFSYGYRNLGR